MSNYLSILGFGQCGSKIAVEISASFNPSNVIAGDSPFTASLQFLIENFGKRPPKSLDDTPSFYIADLNTSNDVYIYFTKAQVIREYLPQLENLSTKEIVAKVNRNRDGVLIKESDIAIVEEVKNRHKALSMIKSLYFEANKKPLLEMGGAGGLQYLSEAIADQDSNLLNSIDRRKNGALIGIFSLGGGTGSGSLFAILSKYKKLTQRYTVGVGVLPSRTSLDEYSNAGRYLTKYMGTPTRQRFHTLILFSNEAAEQVLMDEITQYEGMEPMKIINEYISEFIHDFSLINDDKTITKFGKLFDPMDGKRYLSGICTIGYCSGKDFSPRDYFSKAISPLTFEDRRLSGLTVRITQAEYGESEQKEIVDLIQKILEGLEVERLSDDDIEMLTTRENEGLQISGNLNELKQNICRLRSATPFYRTVKQVRVFYFIKNTAFVRSAFRFQRVIRQFFQIVSGSKVRVAINCYYVPASESLHNSILVIFGGAFCFEIYESVLEYADLAFAKDRDGSSEIVDLFNDKLAEVRELEYTSSRKLLDQFVGSILSDSEFLDVESTDDIDSAEIYHHPDLQNVISNEKLEKILLKKEHLRISLTEIMSNFTLGDKFRIPKQTPF